MMKTPDEIAKYEQQLEAKQLQLNRRIALADKTISRLEHRGTSSARSKRTHRLIQLGAELESVLGKEITPETLKEILSHPISNGRTLRDVLRHELEVTTTEEQK